MLSGMGGMGNYSSMMQMQEMRQKDPENMFSKIDESGLEPPKSKFSMGIVRLQ